MEPKELLKHVDHTQLSPTATWEEIRRLLDDAIRFGTASVCIPPSYVRRAKQYAGDRLKICTVIGFPLGYNTTPVKAYETKMALEDGADEIDMVVNNGWTKDGEWDRIEEEIRQLKTICKDKILKVIIEACLLTQEEKIKLCELVTKAGADFIKTSTGFSKGGATFEDVELFKKHVGPDVKIKAAGGISSLEDAEKFLALGAERLGTSRVVKLIKENHEG